MEKLCCDCANLNRDDVCRDWYSGKETYRCKKHWKYVKLDDKACNSFAELRTTGSYTPSGCFITTIICNILGYEDDCELLTVLRNFRDTILKANPEYLPILLEYDKVGPMISNKIQNESNNNVLCLGLLNYFLIPCVGAIKNNNIEEAVDIYQNMVMQLHDDYELPVIKVDTTESYDLETLGKGRIREIKPSNN